jgi:hypothetical protein
MKVISEISLRDFKFWSGGEERAKNCTDEQLDKIESIMESDAPESGWTDDDINNFFWFDFDTIVDWLGYKDEKHFDAGVREDDVKEAQDWFDGITDTEDMIGIAGFDREDYISTDEDGKEEFDEDLVCYDFSNWWDNMDDIAQVELELYILCQIILGIGWDANKMGKWFWQSNKDRDLVILKNWVTVEK